MNKNSKRLIESDDDVLKPIRKNSWSKNETIWLVIGVLTYEKGNWAQILSKFENKFKKRTGVMLKDKYRTLENNKSELNEYKILAKSLINELMIKP